MRGTSLRQKVKIALCFLLCLAMAVCLLACEGVPAETTAPPTTEPVVRSFASADFPEELKPYLSPWDFDAPKRAKQEGRIHYYFMSNLGLVMDPASETPAKWGDSCLIVFPNGQTMLVDSGYDGYAPVLVENLKRLGIQQLDYVLFSHEHIDHVGGALSQGGVFDSFPVGRAYWSGIQYPKGHEVRQQCQDRGIELKTVRSGYVLRFEDVRLEVLWPEVYYTTESAQRVRDQNNLCVVFRLEYGEHSSLFPGDLDTKGEGQVLQKVGDRLNVDLVKISHHGQNTSSSAAFVQQVSPKLAIATGFMTIDPLVEEAYRSTGATVLTDLTHGYIHVSSDGSDLVHEPG